MNSSIDIEREEKQDLFYNLLMYAGAPPRSSLMLKEYQQWAEAVWAALRNVYPYADAQTLRDYTVWFADQCRVTGARHRVERNRNFRLHMLKGN